MHLCVILNAQSGTLQQTNASRVRDELTEAFQQAGHSVRAELTDGAGLSQALRTACAERPDAIVIGGGDGTIRSAGAALVGSGIALGVLPFGTMNLLAHDLGIPMDVADALRVLANAEVTHIDVGDVNGEMFLCKSCIGIVPVLSEVRERYRSRPWYVGVPLTAWYFVRVLFGFRRMGLQVDRGYGREKRRCIALEVNNNSAVSGPFHFPRRRLPNQGKLEVVYVESPSGWGYVWANILGLLGFSRNHVHVEAQVMTSLQVFRRRRRRLWVANDGELVRLKTPLSYTLHPQALAVLVPRGTARRIAAPPPP